jgi:hypothetical protein
VALGSLLPVSPPEVYPGAVSAPSATASAAAVASTAAPGLPAAAPAGVGSPGPSLPPPLPALPTLNASDPEAYLNALLGMVPNKPGAPSSPAADTEDACFLAIDEAAMRAASKQGRFLGAIKVRPPRHHLHSAARLGSRGHCLRLFPCLMAACVDLLGCVRHVAVSSCCRHGAAVRPGCGFSGRHAC